MAVSRTHDSILTIETQAGWLLPCFEASSLPALLAPLEAMLQDLTDDAQIVHIAPLSREPSASVQQCYALVRVPGPCRSDNSANVVPRSPDILTRGHALLPMQRVAVATALERLRHPHATFDTDVAVDAALAWAERQIADRFGARLLSIARHRCMRHDYVVRLETTIGTMYFKGGRERIGDEAELTRMLWGLEPTRFPETVAIDRVHHRWLYRALEGEPLAGSLLTEETISLAVTTLARLQQRAMHEPAIRALLHHRQMTARALLQRVEDCVQRAVSSKPNPNPPFAVDSWNTTVSILAARCDAMDALDLPMTLVLSDFWTQNTLWTAHGIGFIDVEHSYWSYPVLPLWRFIHDVSRRPGMGRGEEIRLVITQTFTAAWRNIIPPDRMDALIIDLPMLGALFGLLLASRDLDLDEQSLGSALSPDYRAQRLAPHVRQVHKEVH